MQSQNNTNIEKLPLISLNYPSINNNKNDSQTEKRNKIIDEFLNTLDNKNNKNNNNDLVNNSNNNSHNSSDFDIKELQINEGEIDPFDSTEIKKLKNLKTIMPENKKSNLFSRNDQSNINSTFLGNNKNIDFFPTFTHRHRKFKFKNKNISINNLILTQIGNNNKKDKFNSMNKKKIRNITNYNNLQIDNLKQNQNITIDTGNKKNIKRSYSLNNIIDNKNSKKIMTSNFKGAQLYLMHSRYLFGKRNFTAKINKNDYLSYTSRNNNANSRIMSTINAFNNFKKNNKNFSLRWKNKNKLYDDKFLSKKELKLKLAGFYKNNPKNEEKYNSSSKQRSILCKDICKLKGHGFNSFFG